MFERKNDLNIEEGQVKEDDNITSYKPIPDNDSELPPARNITKSRERLSSDGAEEKLLEKGDAAKIATRVDMADAKYVVEDHRNGDAKIELDANKKQFSGLTKEELMKYADDPFWVRLRWTLFVLFWALWLGMLAGAVAIIVTAPRCSPPAGRQWYERGPIAELSVSPAAALERDALFQSMRSLSAEAIVVPQDDPFLATQDEHALDQIRGLVAKAKEYGTRVIVELTASYVPTSHAWFKASENRSGEFTDYFIWGKSSEFDGTNPKPPNQWVSPLDTPAWTLSPVRGEYYYHGGDPARPQLNYRAEPVVKRFDDVLRAYARAGVAGIRLKQARELLVVGLQEETPASGAGSDRAAGHTQYTFWRHEQRVDRPELDALLQHWAAVVDSAATEKPTVFTIAEDGSKPELYLLGARNLTLRPATAAPVDLSAPAADVARRLTTLGERWPAVKLTKGGQPVDAEIIAFSFLLPAAAVVDASALDSSAISETLTDMGHHLSKLRTDASVAHGNYSVMAAVGNATEEAVLVCARWKAGHTGYAAVYNAGGGARADISRVPSVPVEVSLLYATPEVRVANNYTLNKSLKSADLFVPGGATLVLSYVPKTTVEK